MLRAREILTTPWLPEQSGRGWFVLRRPRPDRSFQTFWRQAPPDDVLLEPALEVVLPEAAELSELPADLLLPGTLPELWPEGQRLRLAAAGKSYFVGGHVVKVKYETHEEEPADDRLPKAAPATVQAAVAAAVQQGRLWLLAGAGSIWGETVLPGLLTGTAELLSPPDPIQPAVLLPEKLPGAWSSGVTTGRALLDVLSAAAGLSLPWPLVGTAISAAIQGRLLERSEDSGPWPCDLAGAGLVRLRRPASRPQPPIHVPAPTTPAPQASLGVAQAGLSVNDLQDLNEAIGLLNSAAVGHGLKILVRLEVGSEATVKEDLIVRLNQILDEAQVTADLRFR